MITNFLFDRYPSILLLSLTYTHDPKKNLNPKSSKNPARPSVYPNSLLPWRGPRPFLLRLPRILNLNRAQVALLTRNPWGGRGRSVVAHLGHHRDTPVSPDSFTSSSGSTAMQSWKWNRRRAVCGIFFLELAVHLGGVAPSFSFSSSGRCHFPSPMPHLSNVSRRSIVK